MKNILTTSLLVLFTFNITLAYSQYTSVPDEYFEQELINQQIDSDNTINGVVLTSDVNTITTLIIPGGFFNNLIGIEDFVSLERFEIYIASNLTSLNLSNSPNLHTVVCQFTAINSLNISNNLLLKTLLVPQNNLTSLNVSNNVLLEELLCASNYLTSLDVTNNSNLNNLGCYANLLTTIDVSNNNELEILNVSINILTELNLSANTNLEILSCGRNLLTDLSLATNTNLDFLYCGKNFLTELNLATNSNLVTVNCEENLFETLNFNYNTLISNLNCSNNPNLTLINIQNGSNLLLNGTFPNGQFPPIYFNRFRANNNPNLTCIFVDNVLNCTENWLGIDSNSDYVANETKCNNLSNIDYEKTVIEVYPNPTNDILYTTNNLQIKEVILYDIFGKTILKRNTNIDIVDISNLENGIYFMKIITSNNIQKVVKVYKN